MSYYRLFSGVVLEVIVIAAIAKTWLHWENYKDARTAVSVLTESTDNLTRYAFSYANSGDKEFLAAFDQEVAIRGHGGSNLIEKLPFSRIQRTYADAAMKLSDELAKIERSAFQSIEDGDIDKARDILYGNEYQSRKDEIILVLAQLDESLVNSGAQALRLHFVCTLLCSASTMLFFTLTNLPGEIKGLEVFNEDTIELFRAKQEELERKLEELGK